jgi:hypothetical protein
VGGEFFGISHRRVAHSRAARTGTDFLHSTIAERKENLGLPVPAKSILAGAGDWNFTKEIKTRDPISDRAAIPCEHVILAIIATAG